MDVETKSDGGAAFPPLWGGGQSYIRVLLRDVMTEARVGLHPWEQHPQRPTRLLVNIEMFAKLDGAIAAGGEQAIINYDPVREALRAWPSRPHTPLLETLLQELVAVCFANPRVDACRVSVVKPDVFNEVAAAGVEAYVRRADHQAALAAAE